jgi:hypothetical protein
MIGRRLSQEEAKRLLAKFSARLQRKVGYQRQGHAWWKASNANSLKSSCILWGRASMYFTTTRASCRASEVGGGQDRTSGGRLHLRPLRWAEGAGTRVASHGSPLRRSRRFGWQACAMKPRGRKLIRQSVRLAGQIGVRKPRLSVGPSVPGSAQRSFADNVASIGFTDKPGNPRT